MIFDLPILSTLIWLPILGGLLILFVGSNRDAFAKWFALFISVVTFLCSIPLWTNFDTTTSAMQFVERVEWIPQFNIYYSLGVDGLSMPLVLLTTFTQILVIASAWDVIKERVEQYMGAFMIMQGLMIGVFVALDGILFYVFWEALLIPMFIVIGKWGGPNRVYATIKFFLYTFFGSVFMLVAFLYMYFQSGSFSILDFHTMSLSHMAQILIFLAFLIAFAVKVPMFPVHTWLPDAHVQAPTAGSVVLAAIMLKMGGYGFVRFSLPITPDAAMELDWLVIVLSLIAIFYIGLVAMVQSDMKKLVAYSSISHMGFVTIGMFLVYDIVQNTGSIQGSMIGMEGAMIQMISHGFISGAMFLMIGVLYDRMHTREISAYGGVVNTMPWFGFFAVLFAMANAGLPGTSGFVGEFMVILASFKANVWYGVIAASTLIIGAAYTLWMVKRVFFGAVANDNVGTLQDLNKREFAIMATLAVAVVLLGVYPAPLIEVMHSSVANLLIQATTSKL
ncbi:NADH-quinone oxidoreductase subunit M [Thiomicrospira sp. S5]|jgi:NADH-quinone oxidoreductase subunit M|uniref:NADH-quinone oxidoreductase subunit M n=1 Tax=Thiomicrospira sp. S5 TaxID=1803865 RepID=UPI0004A6F0E3|nr:NADH-quinone oxidoreductase subunit M [Thiomicrospira sp. S5]AZR82423.1 NADH:ubiquinone oxidoreductase subunit M [Thiomicrospira sp. S5]